MNLKDRKANISKEKIKNEDNKNPRLKPSNTVSISLDLSNANVSNKNKKTKIGSALNTPPQKSFFSRVQNFAIHHKITSTFLLILFGCSLFTYFEFNQLRNKSNLNLSIFGLFKTSIIAAIKSDENALLNLQKTNERTNILLVGIDKRDNNSSLLTDSIMLISYDHNTKDAAQISFPRDLKVDYKVNNLQLSTRINEVFYYGYQNAGTENIVESNDFAFKELGEVVEDVTGQPIHYGAMINFNGLKDIVDSLGGVTVNVDKTFIDCKFPNEEGMEAEKVYEDKIKYGCDKLVTDIPNYIDDEGYMVAAFEQGEQQLDGAAALRYARSRYSFDPEEGSDFARAKRQQKVVQAIKETALGSDIGQKFTSLNDISSIIGNNIQFYNIGDTELQAFLQGRDAVKDISLFSMVVDTSFGSYIEHLLNGAQRAEYNGAYLIYPNDGTYEEVNNLVDFYLKNAFLLKENTNMALGYADANRYKEYLEIKDIIIEKKLKIAFVDTKLPELIKPTDEVVSTISEDSNPKTVLTLYKLAHGKDQTVEFYKQLLSQNNIDVQVKNKEELPEEFKEKAKDIEIFIVLE